MAEQIMRRTISADKDLLYALREIKAMPYPFRITVESGKETRTKAQNRYLHRLFGDISSQGDQSPAETKAQCNREYGKPILHRDDPEWAAVWDYMFEPLSYAAQLVAIRRLDIAFTRNMNVKQLSEYTEQLLRDYRGQGFILTDPEMQGR